MGNGTQVALTLNPNLSLVHCKPHSSSSVSQVCLFGNPFTAQASIHTPSVHLFIPPGACRRYLFIRPGTGICLLGISPIFSQVSNNNNNFKKDRSCCAYQTILIILKSHGEILEDDGMRVSKETCETVDENHFKIISAFF